MADAGAYLLLVSFLTGAAADLRPARAEVICDSPYDGVAAWYHGPYEHDPIDDARRRLDFEAAARLTGKHVWPWVFLNRMIGYNPKPGDRAERNKEWYRRIGGIDLDDRTGDRTAFVSAWRGALRAARATGCPGIFADFEAYNDYRAYKLDYLAERCGEDLETVRVKLKALGAELADVAIAEHPTAVLWFTFTGIGDKKWAGVLKGYDYRSVTWVILGLLERAGERGAGLTVVSGGMITHGYCTRDLPKYRTMIGARRMAYADALRRYPNLELGATIAPWNDRGRRDGWLKRACGLAPQATAEDFVPYFRELLASHRWVWIYGAGVSDYRPFEADSAPEMHQALRDARLSAAVP